VSKSPDAFRTISEVAEDLDLPQHVLRFWETRFTQIKPMKRGGGRRYYRPDDVDLLRGIRHLLYGEGYTIRGVQRILKEQGSRSVVAAGRGEYADGKTGGGDSEAIAAADDPGAGEPHRPERIEPSFETEAPRRGTRRSAGAMASEARDKPDGAEETAGLAPDDVERLKVTLAELLECKRLLDQAR